MWPCVTIAIVSAHIYTSFTTRVDISLQACCHEVFLATERRFINWKYQEKNNKPMRMTAIIWLVLTRTFYHMAEWLLVYKGVDGRCYCYLSVCPSASHCILTFSNYFRGNIISKWKKNFWRGIVSLRQLGFVISHNGLHCESKKTGPLLFLL